MEKYIRKIVHLELINKEHCINVAYYKLEKRSGKCKITLSIEGIRPLQKEDYYFCILYKRGQSYFIKEIQPIKVDRIGKINTVISVNQVWMDDFKGVLIRSCTREPVLVGYYDEVFSLNNLKIEDEVVPKYVKKSNDELITDNICNNESGEINQDNTDDAQVLQGNDTENENKHDEDQDKINNQGNQIYKDIQHKTLPLEDKVNEKTGSFNNNRDYNRNEDRRLDYNTLDTNIPNSNILNTLNRQRLENNNTNFKQDSQNQNKEQSNMKTDGGLNTIEYIKKQLEIKEEIKIIDEIFQKNGKITPFDNQDEKTEWVKIEITDLVFLPLESWILMNNAFLMTCYRKYKHLILGRSKEEGFLKLGIPDIYYFKESLIANVCGFDEFYPCNGKNPKSGEYGYWIIKTIL